jgi:hypothetical protein
MILAGHGRPGRPVRMTSFGISPGVADRFALRRAIFDGIEIKSIFPGTDRLFIGWVARLGNTVAR